MRRIVICSDGTWCDRDRGFTNVARFAQAVLPSDPADGTPQVVYYDSGVGADWSLLARLTGGAFGRGLSANVLDAYRFLVDNHEPGDELFLVGYSRGAFTVRSLAGLIRKCGILHKRHSHLAGRAYDIYRTRASRPGDRTARNGVDGEPARSFRERFSLHPVPIRFIGVWDTVGALGVPTMQWWLPGLARRRWGFHDLDLSRHVRFAAQALAIDERRRPFKPAPWTVQAPAPGIEQHVEQRWFAGVHGDVGGGYAARGLSDIAFLWMCERAREAGLALDVACVEPAPDPLGPLHDSMTWYYALLGRPWRRIGDEGGQTVAPEALARFAEPAAGYRPPNLAAYLAAAEVEHGEATPA